MSAIGAGAYEAWLDNHQEREDEEGQVTVHSPRLFGMGRCGFLETAYKEKLDERAGVMSPSLCCESKEDKEDECANDTGPPGESVPRD